MGTRSGERRSLLFSSPVRARTRYFFFRPKKNPEPSSQANEEAITLTSRKLYSRNALEECYSLNKH